MAQIDLLTPLEVKKAKTTKKVEYMPDGRGLYLRVRDNGEKYFKKFQSNRTLLSN